MKIMRYNPSLDGVRAVAVVAVMAFHAKVSWAPGGYFGVDIFFVLSGYLITSLLLSELQRNERIDLVGFYARRLLRLAPAMLLLLVIYVATAAWLFPQVPYSASMRDAVVVLMYFSDYTQALFGYPQALLHTWSLAVEEHFYLIWPLLLGLFAGRVPGRRRSRTAFVVLTAVLFMLATNWRLLAAGLGQSWVSLYYRFDSHASGLLLGCLVGAVLSGRSTDERKRGGWFAALLQLLPLVGLLAMACNLTWKSWGYPNGYLTCIELMSAMLIAGLALWPQTWLAAVLSLGPVRYVGQISYGIYLWDFPTAYVLHSRFPGLSPNQALLLTAAITLLMASASYFSVEKLARRLKPRTYAIGGTGSH